MTDISFGGSAGVEFSVSYVASGGLNSGGSSSGQVTIPYTASGTLRFGSSSSSNPIHYYTASGGLNFGGSVAFSSSYWIGTAGGSLSLGGSADSKQTLEGQASGTTNFGGSADAKVTLYYEASGSLSTRVAATAIIKIDYLTRFVWDISQGVLRTWRVEGKCRPSNHPCPPTSNQDPGCPPNGSTMQYVANVQAHSITDLCQRLKRRGMLGPIKKIQMWSLPVNKSDWSPTDSINCNSLSTIDFTKVPDCLDFTVDQDLSVSGKVTASLIFMDTFVYEASGGLGTGGATVPISNFFTYQASGGLNSGGTSSAQSPQYYVYVASGGLGFGGVVNAYGSDYGIVSASGKFGMTVMDLGIVFGKEDAPVLSASAAQIAATCCTALNLPQILFVKHELSRSDQLSNFLKINGFSLPPIVKVMFNQQRNSWHFNQQFRGTSVDQNVMEEWNVIFEFGCLTENALLGIPADVWGFSVMVRKRNLINSRVSVTRLVLEFDPVRVCDISGSLKFDFTFNTDLLSTSPSVIRTVVFTDDVGSFNGSSYTNNPITSFEVSAATPSLGVGLFDQSIPFQNMLLSGTI